MVSWGDLDNAERRTSPRYTKADGTAEAYFEYGSHKLLTRVTPPAGSPWKFYYDARLNRYKIDRAGTITYYLWEGLNLLEERGADGALKARYTHGYTPIPGIGSVVEVERVAGGGTYFQYPLADHRGTVYAVTDANQATQLSYVQDAFGVPLAGIGGADPSVPNDLIYSSDWLTLVIGGKKLMLSKYRIYDPEIGIFLSRDWLPFPNLYKAFENDPVNESDPDGLSLWDWAITGEWNPSPEGRAAANASIANESGFIGGAGSFLTGVARVGTEVGGTLGDIVQITARTGYQNALALQTLGFYGQFGRLDAEDLRGTTLSSFYEQVAQARAHGQFGLSEQGKAAAEIFWRGNPITGGLQALFDLINSCSKYEAGQNTANLALVLLPLANVRGLTSARPPGATSGLLDLGGRPGVSPLRQILRKVYDPRDFNLRRGNNRPPTPFEETVSRDIRTHRGLVNEPIDLHHWLFKNSWKVIPQGLRNAHGNLVEVPRFLNQNLFTKYPTTELAAKGLILGNLAAGTASTGINSHCKCSQPSQEDCANLRRWLDRQGWNPFL